LRITAAFDHLVIAAETLEQGEDHLEALLGARPKRGGKHVAMGTHNSLLRLGERSYIELIAIDPEGTAPTRPRWFDLDRPATREALASSPRLIHWAVNCEDIEAARRACPVDPGPARDMARGALTWRITIPDDGHLPGAGVIPTLIQWPDARHPADAMPDSHVGLVALAASHPEPASVRAALDALSLAEALKVTYGMTPRLAAMLKTPRGVVTL